MSFVKYNLILLLMPFFVINSYAWYFTLLQCVVYITLAYAQGGYKKNVTAPWKTYFILSFVWVGSVGLTKASLKYINYPAQIMFKSSKVSISSFCWALNKNTK